jgi:hypothetical protein
VRGQVSHPFITAGKIMELCILIFMFLWRRWQVEIVIHLEANLHDVATSAEDDIECNGQMIWMVSI